MSRNNILLNFISIIPKILRDYKKSFEFDNKNSFVYNYVELFVKSVGK